MRKRPSAPVSTDYSCPVATVRSTTRAPGSVAPLGSDTEPATVAALTGTAVRIMAMVAASVRIHILARSPGVPLLQRMGSVRRRMFSHMPAFRPRPVLYTPGTAT